MKTYEPKDIVAAFKEAGIRRGDTVFFTARMLVVGRLKDALKKEDFCQAYLTSIRDLIGSEGTLVMPTYTQQVGRYGIPYVHESSPTPSGVLNEYFRQMPGAVRSFHPVFSLTAIGPKANEICGSVGVTGFGATSAYANLFRLGGIGVSLGFDFESGHVTTGAHYVTVLCGSPYYYHKILDADVYKDDKKSNKVFVLNVAYRQFGIEADYALYMNTLKNKNHVRSAKLGDSTLYACDLKAQLSVGYELLTENAYAFLKNPPQWVPGAIPYDGCEEKKVFDEQSLKNDIRMGIGERWVNANQQLQPA